MLIFWSIDLSRLRVAARDDARRASRREDAGRRFTFVTTADLDDGRPETVGAEGTTGTAVLGGAGD
jgi:hypothetical protein